MKRRSGWVVDTLESLYVGRGAPDLDFGARTLRAMAPGLDVGSGVGFSLVDFNDLKWRFFGLALPDGTLLDFSAQPPNLGFSEDEVAGLFKRLYSCPAPVSLLTELLGVNDLRDEPALGEVLEPFPHIVDALGMPSIPQPGLGLCAYAPLPAGATVNRALRRQWTRLAFHLETAVRQRLSGKEPVGVVTTEGRVDLVQDLPHTTRENLKAQVRAIEQLRRRGQRTDDELAMETWQALVGGHLSLFEQVDSDGRRQYSLYENPPRAVTTLALSRVESAVISQVSRGVTSKEVSYALGLSASQVSRALKTASEKLGLSSGLEAVRVAALLQPAPRPAKTTTPLTAAEREVMLLLGEGLSDEEVALRRGTSARTVANQVAALLRKTGAHTRRAFLGVARASH